MDNITLQNEIDKARMNPAFSGFSDSEIRDMLLSQTDLYASNTVEQGSITQSAFPELSQESVSTDMSWNNPYEYQGPTSIMEDAQSAISIGQELHKGVQTIFGKEKVADFTGKIKNMFTPVGTAVPMLKGATMTKAATFANVSNPAMMSSAGGTGALAGLGPLAAVAAGVYLWNKNKKKKREKQRRQRMEQYQDFRETEREKLREGQQDYFSMAGKYSNPYNV